MAIYPARWQQGWGRRPGGLRCCVLLAQDLHAKADVILTVLRHSAAREAHFDQLASRHLALTVRSRIGQRLISGRAESIDAGRRRVTVGRLTRWLSYRPTLS